MFQLFKGVELAATGSFADLWKYGIAQAVTILVLFVLIRLGVRALPLSFVLGLLGLASLVLNYRSHALICVAAAAIVFTGRLVAPRFGRFWQYAVVVGCGVLFAVLMPIVARTGLLGSALQAKVLQQDATDVPLLFAGRTEPPLSLTAIWERPLLGWGSPAAMTKDLLIDAEHLAVSLGYSPTLPFEQFWRIPGDYFALHSILLGSWAEGGILAFLLPVWLLVACVALVWNQDRYGMWAPLMVVLGVQGIWDLAFSPWTYGLIPVYVCIALFCTARHWQDTAHPPMEPKSTFVGTVSAVIPTIGRPSIGRAVRSVLAQTRPVHEVIVVADTAGDLALPTDDRIRVIRVGPGAGAAVARQAGIDAATGSVIALLDDDDEWRRDKLQTQLAAVRDEAGDRWIVSSRFDVDDGSGRRRVWPRNLVQPGQSLADYLFRFRDLTMGGAALQSSTLVFPAALARTVRWDTDPESIHDEAGWLLRVQRAFPDIRVVQVPQVLSVYHVGEPSVSRAQSDRSDDYVAWGLDYLADEPARIRGDYLCTSPVSAAVSAGSAGSVGRAVRAGLRHGRPGPYALGYAGLNAVRTWFARLRGGAKSSAA